MTIARSTGPSFQASSYGAGRSLADAVATFVVAAGDIRAEGECSAAETLLSRLAMLLLQRQQGYSRVGPAAPTTLV